jgi:predicted ATPase
LEKACQALRKALIPEPWREESHRGLMRLLALDGQRSAALAQYAQCQRELKSALGVEPAAETVALYERIRDGEPSLAGAPIRAIPPTPAQEVIQRPSHNLPRQLTSFIGREAEAETIQSLLETNALVSLVGFGGVGKTRIALRVAEVVKDSFADGIWLVDLAPINDGDLVLPTVARLLGMHIESGPQAEEALLEYCLKRQLLLMLDNCEHLITTCSRLAEAILSACPQVKILAISREILGVLGEVVYSLSPFTTPGADEPFETLSQYEAVRLFIDRAAKIRPGFALTRNNAASIGKICAQLDGIPLAIELAAAWVRLLPVEQINLRLGESLDYLHSGGRTALPRQQTMRGCLDWSYHLLKPEEQSLFQSLAVFTGGWTLEAAEAICTDRFFSQKDVLDLLDQLAMKSLIEVEHSPEFETRYRLLVPVRQYAGEKLASEKLNGSGDMDTIRDRHLAYYQGLAEQAAPHLRARRQIEWLRRLERELPNIRQALEWACRVDGPLENLEKGLQLGADLRFFWQSRCRYLEGPQRLERLLDLEQERRGEQPLSLSITLRRAWALMVTVAIRWNSGSIYYDPAKFHRYMEECLALSHQLGEAGRRCLAHARLVSVPMSSNLPSEQTMLLLQEIYTEAEVLGEPYLLAQCSFQLGNCAYEAAKPELAGDYFQKSLSICLEVGDLDFLPALHAWLGRVAFEQGDIEKARRLTAEAWERGREVEVDLPHSAGYVHLLLGELGWYMGDYTQAEKDIAKSLELVEKLGGAFGFYGLYGYGIAASQGEYEKARFWLQKIKDIHLGVNIGKTEFWFIYLFGELDWAMGDRIQANRRFIDLKQAALAPDQQVMVRHNTSFPLLDLEKEAVGDREIQILAEWGLAKVALSEGRWRAATEHMAQAISRQFEMPKFTGGIIEDDYTAVTLAAVLATSQGQFTRAASLLGAADRSYQLYGKTFPLYRQQLIEQAITDTRASLDEATFSIAWEEGKAMDLNQALEYARQVVEEMREAL